MDIKNKFNEFNEFNEDSINKCILYGELLGVEEEGFFNGEESSLVLMKTENGKNKPLFLWVLFPKNDSTLQFIKDNKNNNIFIEGYLYVEYNFNNKAVTHTFVIPEIIEVDKDIEFKDSEEFYKSYTMGNRVFLEGIVKGDSWVEFIPNVNKYVTRFKLSVDIDGIKRNIYCTMWDTVNKIGELKNGMRIKLVGSYSMLKKERGLVVEDGLVLESRKNRLDSYVVIIQKIDLLEFEIREEDN